MTMPANLLISGKGRPLGATVTMESGSGTVASTPTKPGAARYRDGAWHVAASSLASREGFAERIAIMDAAARGSAVYGQVAFGDPDVGWRDHDGPRETLGYRGGALLAFHADVELRRQQPVAKVL